MAPALAAGLEAALAGLGPAVEAAFAGAATQAIPDAFRQAIDRTAAPVQNSLRDAIGKAFEPAKKNLAVAAESLAAALAPVAAAVQVAMEPVVVAMKLVTAPLRAFGLALTAAFAPVRVFFDLIERLADAPLKAFEAAVSVAARLLTSSLSPIGRGLIALENFVRKVEWAVRAFEAPWAGLTDTLESARGMVDGAFDAVAKAVENPLKGIPELLSSVRGYVESVDAYSVQAFDAAMRDLTAVIGTALRPVFVVATKVVREFSDALWPVMERVQPALEGMAKAIGGQLIELIPTFANALADLVPVVNQMAREMVQSLKNQAAWLTAMNTVGRAVDAVRAALDAMTAGVGSAFGSLFTAAAEAGGQVRAAFASIAEGVRAALAGAVQAIDGVFRGLGGTVLAAVTGVFGPVWKAMAGAVEPVRKALAEAIRPLADLFGRLRSGTLSFSQQIARATIAVAGFVTRLFGGREAFDEYVKSLAGPERAKEGTKDSRGLAQAQNPQWRTIEDLGRSAMQQAFVATSQRDIEPKIGEDEFRIEVLKDLDALGKFDLKAVLREFAGELAQAIVIASKEKAVQKTEEFRDERRKYVSDPVFGAGTGGVAGLLAKALGLPI